MIYFLYEVSEYLPFLSAKEIEHVESEFEQNCSYSELLELQRIHRTLKLMVDFLDVSMRLSRHDAP